MRLVVSDAHTALVEAIAANLPGAVWQRCRTHYAANLMSITPKSLWPAVKAMLNSVYDQPDAPAMHAQFDRLLDYVTDKAAELLVRGADGGGAGQLAVLLPGTRGPNVRLRYGKS